MTTHRITPTGVPLTTVAPDDTETDVAGAQADVLAALYGTPYVVPGEPIDDPRPAAGEDVPGVGPFADRLPTLDMRAARDTEIRDQLDAALDEFAGVTADHAYVDEVDDYTIPEPDGGPCDCCTETAATNTPTNTAGELLREANYTISQRDQIHGRERLLAPIADLWSAYLNADVAPWDVANMMILLKTARSRRNPLHRDSFLDIAGYAALGHEAAEQLA